MVIGTEHLVSMELGPVSTISSGRAIDALHLHRRAQGSQVTWRRGRSWRPGEADGNLL